MYILGAAEELYISACQQLDGYGQEEIRGNEFDFGINRNFEQTRFFILKRRKRKTY